MNLTKTNWPDGWTPSADKINGPPEGLLRMDNLQEDEDGVLGIVRGLKLSNAGPFPDYVDQIFSKNINGVDVIWSALGTTRQVLRNNTVIVEGNNRVAFGDGLGEVLIFAGNQRKKDNLTTVTNIGLHTAGTPQISEVTQPSIPVEGSWFMNEGHANTPNNPGGISAQVADNTSRGIVGVQLPSPFDTTNIGDGPSVDPSTDFFNFGCTISDSALVFSVRMDVVLDDSYTGVLADTSNYYTFIWKNKDLLPGIDARSSLTVQRGSFIRSGTDTDLDWKHVTAVLITLTCTDTGVVYVIDGLNFTGGVAGQLNGTYEWIQVNISNNGHYLAKSPCGVKSVQKTVINGYVTITPAPVTDNGNDNITEIWLYRKSTAKIDVNQPDLPLSQLDQFYRIAVTSPGVAVRDDTSDFDATIINIKLNPFLISVQPLVDGNGLIDDVFGVEGVFHERMIYMTINALYLSDRLDPDAIDSRYTIKASGDPIEKNLWIKRVSNNLLVLGTSRNLYAIVGTLLDLPDGTLDIAIEPIGEAYPPLTMDAIIIPGGGVAYTASDGIRVTNGTNSTLISPQLNLLFQGKECNGVPPIVISEFARYSLSIGKNRIYAALPTSGGRRLFVYDLIKKQWRIQYTDPVTVFVTSTDKVLLGYNTSTVSTLSGAIYEVDNGLGINTSGTTTQGLPFTFQTVYDANNQPRNRKDTFTLKLVLDTGNSDVSVYIAKDGGNFLFLSDIKSDGISTKYLALSSNDVTLGFRYAIKIVDKNLVTVFKLYEMTIEYEPRPEQLNYLHIPNVNLGTVSRKRIVNYAFIIDTLGNNITFTPYVDNSNASLTPPTSNVNTTAKQTNIHYFTTETVGTDIGGTLSGGVFEFYNVNLEEIVSEKLPVPVKYLLIPANNYGTPNRKRHSSYKFQINTRGADVTFIPILDGIAYDSRVFNTGVVKKTVEYFFDLYHGDVLGIDIGGILTSDSPFEFYGVVTPQEIEQLPPRLEYFKIPNNNLGSISRKRFMNYAFVIDTYGFDVTFTPLIDNSNVGILPAATTVNSNGKQTYIHYFTQEQLGTDIGGFLKGDNPFEFYGIDPQKIVSEDLPTPTKYLVIPANDYGKPNRKRHSSYKFQINTRGQNVSFTPLLDGIAYAAATFNTTRKTTVEYFFDTALGDIIGIDIGGTLQSLSDTPFEFYGVVIPQEIEVLPPRLEYFRIPNNNFGIAARKRIRTIPLIIDTYGRNVTFVPIVDGIGGTPSIHNTSGKITSFHYFNTDIFGTDYGGSLVDASGPFEFYGFGQPEDVEVLPVAKKYDQLGPLRFDKIGKIFTIRIRMIMTGSTTSVPFTILGDDDSSVPFYGASLYSGTFDVSPLIDNVYEITLPKSINTDVFRLTLGPTADAFHRYTVEVRVQLSGMSTDAKWVPLR